MIKTEWIYYFVELTKLSSTNLVADKLFTSQSTISRSISQLEASLNVSLFKRSYAGMQLTSAGEKLLPYAKQYLTAYENLFKATENMAPVQNIRPKITINLYATPAFLDYFAPYLLQISHDTAVNITFFALPTNIDSLDPILNIEDTFIILMATNTLRNNISSTFQVETLDMSKLYVLCAANSQLIPAEVKSISLKRLRTLPFIIYLKGSFMNDAFNTLFKNQKPPFIYESNFNLFQQYIRDDAKVSLATKIFQHTNTALKFNPYLPNNSGIRTIPIVTKLHVELLLIFKAEKISSEAHDFISIIKDLWKS